MFNSFAFAAVNAARFATSVVFMHECLEHQDGLQAEVNAMFAEHADWQYADQMWYALGAGSYASAPVCHCAGCQAQHELRMEREFQQLELEHQQDIAAFEAEVHLHRTHVGDNCPCESCAMERDMWSQLEQDEALAIDRCNMSREDWAEAAVEAQLEAELDGYTCKVCGCLDADRATLYCGPCEDEAIRESNHWHGQCGNCGLPNPICDCPAQPSMEFYGDEEYLDDEARSVDAYYGGSNERNVNFRGFYWDEM